MYDDDDQDQRSNEVGWFAQALRDGNARVSLTLGESNFEAEGSPQAVGNLYDQW